MLLIDHVRLEKLLLSRRDMIGYGTMSGVGAIGAGVSYFLVHQSAEFSDFGFISGKIIGNITIVLFAICCLYGANKMARSLVKPYTHEKLYSEIRGLDELANSHFILAIKDGFNEYANRFLLYYDEKWDCDFFLNCKATENLDTVRERLSNELKVPREKIRIDRVMERVQKKYAPHAGIDKVYRHTLFQVVIEEFPESMTWDEFEVQGKKYRWMTIASMEQDPKIKQRNLEVVNLVKEGIA